MSDLKAKLTLKVGTEGADAIDKLVKQLDKLGGKGPASQMARQGEASQRQLERQVTAVIRGAERQAQAQQKAAERATASAERESKRQQAIAERQAAAQQRLVDREATKIIKAAEREAAAQERAANRAEAAKVRAAERWAAKAQRLAERAALAEIREAERVERARIKAAERAAAAEERARTRGSFWTGHGMGNRFRQGLAVARDATVAMYGLRAAAGTAYGMGASVMEPTAEFQSQLVNMGLKGDYDPQAVAQIRAAIMASARGRSGFSPTQAGAAAIDLAAAGLDAPSLQTALPTTLRFAQSAGIESSASATLLSDTQSQFGLAANDFERIGDVITKAANTSTIAVGDMGESFRYVAPLARAAGMSLEFTGGTLALLGSNGLKGSMGGTALRSMLTSLVHPSKRAKEALETLHLTQKDLQKGLSDLPSFMRLLQDKMGKAKLNTAQRLEISELLFGVEGMTAATVLMRAALDNSDKGWQHFTNAVQDAAGEMKKGAEANANTLSGRMNALKASVEAAKIEVGEKFIPVLERLSPKLQAVANDVANWANAHGEELPGMLEGAAWVGGTALAAKASGWTAALVTSIAGPAATAAVTAAGTTLAGTLFVAVSTAIASWKLGSVIADAIHMDELGARLHRLLNADVPQQENRSLDNKPPTLTPGEKMEKDRIDREGRVPDALKPNKEWGESKAREPGWTTFGQHGAFLGVDINLKGDTTLLKEIQVTEKGPVKAKLARGTNVPQAR